MHRVMKSWLRTAVIVTLMIVTAILCRAYDRLSLTGTPLGFVRSFIYMGLFSWWGASVRRRVLQPQARQLLTMIACLMLFWIFVRSLKYYIVFSTSLIRWIWYSYYIPMLMIPLFFLLTAMSLGKPEHYRLPRWSAALFAITLMLVLLVLSNDCHQLVFSFPEGKVWSDHDYHYEKLYWLILAWEYGLALTALGIIIARCRIHHSRKFALLPFIPLAASFLYATLYVLGVPFLFVIAGDIAVVQCLHFMAIAESCIQSGLIRVNSHYKELFNASDVHAFITDLDDHVYLSAPYAKAYTADTLHQAQKNPVLLPDGSRLSCKPIRGGYAYWSDDVSQVTALLEELEDLNESLKDDGNAMREEYRTEKERLRLQEANRLYNKMQLHTSEHIGRLQTLLSELEQAENSEAECRLLPKLLLLGVYVKRRNNLLFISETENTVLIKELEYCLKESLSALEMQGVTCGYAVNLRGEIPFSDALTLYDRFETLLESTFGKLRSLFVSVSPEDDNYVMSFNLCTRQAVSELRMAGMDSEREDELTWLLTCALSKGDDHS